METVEKDLVFEESERQGNEKYLGCVLGQKSTVG